jgi:hypothetical protein
MNKIIVCILLCLISACHPAEKKHKYSEKIKPDRDVNFLLGKTVKSIDSILSKKMECNYVVYIFNNYDCGNCVNAGFYLLKKIDALHGQIYAITASPDNPAIYQKENNYYEYIYVDSKDLIRRELKYIPTPVFLLLNKENKILDIHFPQDILPEDYKSFLQSCSDKLKTRDSLSITIE